MLLFLGTETLFGSFTCCFDTNKTPRSESSVAAVALQQRTQAPFYKSSRQSSPFVTDAFNGSCTSPHGENSGLVTKSKSAPFSSVVEGVKSYGVFDLC